jgi:dTDP-4-amino-4,6-dideoxygalactose transaminase
LGDPLRRIAFAEPDITEEEIAAVGDCLRSGWLTSGPNVVAFEDAFAK